MATVDIEAIRKDLANINAFVRERFDPVKQEVNLLREETDRFKREIADLQIRERALRRESLMRDGGEHSPLAVSDGPYSGMDFLDLALLRRFAYSQRRKSFGPAWVERTEEAKRSLMSDVSPATIQAWHQTASRKLEAWYTVDRRPTGQFEGFSGPCSKR